MNQDVRLSVDLYRKISLTAEHILLYCSEASYGFRDGF